MNPLFNEFAGDEPFSSNMNDRADDSFLTDNNILGLADGNISQEGSNHLTSFNQFPGDEPLASNMNDRSTDQGKVISQGEMLVRKAKPDLITMKLNSLLSMLSVGRAQANTIRNRERELALNVDQPVKDRESNELKELLTLQHKTGIKDMSELKIGVQFIQRKRALIESNPNAILITKLDKNGQLAKFDRMKQQHKASASLAQWNNDQSTLIKNGAEEMKMLKKMGVRKNEDINAIITFLDAKANLMKAFQVLPLMEVAGDIAKIERHR